MLKLLGSDAKFFLAGCLAAVALRLIFLLHFPAVVDDSRLYADIAMNWLQTGIYGVTDSGQVVPTLSRLPGYPAFLAGVFAILGWSNFRAVLAIQIVFDIAGAFVIADLARRMFSDKAAKAAFMLAALCPFLANYSASALTETLEVFFTAVTLDFAVAGGKHLKSKNTRSRFFCWMGAGLAVAACILLRPDGGILLAALGGYLLWLLVQSFAAGAGSEISVKSQPKTKTILLAGTLMAVSALTPLVPWTLRNLHTFHRFQPLAPRYANDADEPAMPGFNRWTKTWIAEYISVQELYWNVPGDAVDVNRLPQRAFDSTEQRRQTAELFTDYNQDHDMSPELDARFAALAADRIRSAPIRFYLWLPLLRITDMWLRPRTELLPSDPRWWEFNDDHTWLAVSLGLGLMNLLYVVAAGLGAWRSRATQGAGVLMIFLLLRSLFLGTLENPEPRYTLECFPVVIVLAAAFLTCGTRKTNEPHRTFPSSLSDSSPTRVKSS